VHFISGYYQAEFLDLCSSALICAALRLPHLLPPRSVATWRACQFHWDHGKAIDLFILPIMASTAFTGMGIGFDEVGLHQRQKLALKDPGFCQSPLSARG